MALGTGIYGAYRNVQPITEDFGAILAEDEQARFRYRQEQREKQALADERAKDLRDRILKAQSGLNVDASGFSAYDDKIAKVVMKGAEEIDKAYEILKEDPNNLEASKTLMQAEMLPELLKQSITKYQGDIADWAKGLQENKYSEYLNKDWLNATNALIDGRMTLDFRPGQGLVATYDKDMDGVADMGFGGIKGGVQFGQFKERFDSSAFKKEVRDSYGTETVQNEDGSFTTRKIKGLSPTAKRSIRENIDDSFGMTVKSMTDEAKSYLADELGVENPEEIDQKDFDKVKTSFYLENLAQFDTEDIRKKDYSAEQSMYNRYARVAGKGKSKTKDQRVSDYTRTLVDGTIRGDKASLGHWLNITNRAGDAIIDVDWTQDQVVFQFANKKGEDAGQLIIPLDDPTAIGKLATLSNYRKSPQEMMGYYRTGELLDEDFDLREPQNYSTVIASLDMDEALGTTDRYDKTKNVAGVAERYLKPLGYVVSYEDKGRTDIVFVTKPGQTPIAYDLDEGDGKKLKAFILEVGKQSGAVADEEAQGSQRGEVVEEPGDGASNEAVANLENEIANATPADTTAPGSKPPPPQL